MKNMKTILAIVISVVLIAAVISFAETARMGKTYGPAFNPTATVTKTADYTLTSSDSYVKFTASSVNLTATLPAISSLSGQSISYKILKTDATTYKVIVTPATGDTIGGESTRYLISQNAYMIITSGPGRNWTITYESPYIVEDHEAGTYTTGIGSGGVVSFPSTSATLTASDCGTTYILSTSLSLTLPATTANCKMTFISNANTTEIHVGPAAADQIFGIVMSGTTTTPTMTVISGAVGEFVTSGTTGRRGTALSIIGDGVDGWLVTSSTGTSWAEATP